MASASIAPRGIEIMRASTRNDEDTSAYLQYSGSGPIQARKIFLYYIGALAIRQAWVKKKRRIGEIAYAISPMRRVLYGPVSGHELKRQKCKHGEGKQQVALVKPLAVSQARHDDEADEDLQHEAFRRRNGVVWHARRTGNARKEQCVDECHEAEESERPLVPLDFFWANETEYQQQREEPQCGQVNDQVRRCEGKRRFGEEKLERPARSNQRKGQPQTPAR